MMQRFVSIRLPYLITDLLSANQSELKCNPFVVSERSKGRIIITAASALAEAKGIYKGMALADARAICPALQVATNKPGLTDKILRRLAEWCIRFTPIAAVDTYGGVMLDASGCGHLWGCEENYLRDIIKRIEAKGFLVKAAMSDTIGSAWAVAGFASTPGVIQSGQQIQALEHLPCECLRIGADISERLHKLGLHQVKDLLGMQPAALRRRFGNAILQRLNQASGAEAEYIEPVCPPEPFRERLPCLEPIVTRKGIEMALQQLLEALCKRLNSKGKGIREILFKGLRVDSREVHISVSTIAPSTNISHLFKLFSLKLSAIEPALGIELFILEAIKIEDHAPRQEALWTQAGGFEDTRIAELIDRISGKIGVDAVSRYLPAEHYWPERSVRKAVSLKEAAISGWRIEKPRPVRLLPSPEPIAVTAPIPDYPPMMFTYREKLHKIIRADGPERIEQEWWIEDGRHRDYYVVQDEEGSRYWLFRSGHYDAEKSYSWYIHGFFA